MYDLKFVRSNEARLREAIALKGDHADLDRILDLDRRRREILVEVEALKSERNRRSQEIGKGKSAGQDVSEAIAATRTLGDRVQTQDEAVRAIDGEIAELLQWVPNLPHPSVPPGDATANQVVRTWGEPRSGAGLLDHLTLGRELDLIDPSAGSRLSGSGFVVFTGMGARLERALIDFMLDRHVAHGYREMRVPYMTRGETLFGCGQLPKLREDMYAITGEDLYLIPTAEVPLTNVYREVELTEAELPLHLVAYSPCFRREAGTYGKETRGLIRVHQFDKVEMVRLVTPETSCEALEQLTADAEGVLQALELPYRVVLLAAGDLSFASAKCYDLELWAPGEGRWLEVSSCSNFEDFQARRIGLRYRAADGKLRHLHTLNGSGVALPRLTVALLEHYQTPAGTVEVPAVLRPYLGGLTEITPPRPV
jgi:seryl-tRNA synthetase